MSEINWSILQPVDTGAQVQQGFATGMALVKGQQTKAALVAIDLDTAAATSSHLRSIRSATEAPNSGPCGAAMAMKSAGCTDGRKPSSFLNVVTISM